MKPPRDEPISEQLKALRVASKLTLAELIDKSGVDLDAPGLSRRLNGHLDLRIRQAAAIAGVMGYEVRLVKRKRAA